MSLSKIFETANILIIIHDITIQMAHCSLAGRMPAQPFFIFNISDQVAKLFLHSKKAVAFQITPQPLQFVQKYIVWPE